MMQRPDDDDASFRPAPDQVKANLRLLVLDIAWFGLAFPATASFLAVYAIRLDAPPVLLGWLTALPAIVGLITSGLAGWWRGRYPDTVGAMFWPALGFRLAFLLPAFAPFFPAAWRPAWLLVAVGLPAIPQGVASVLFLVLLRESTESHRLAALMGRRSLVFNVTVAISTLAFGLWLEAAPFPLNYQVMFVASFALALMSLQNALKVRPLVAASLPATGQPPLQPWRSPVFRRVAWITVVTHVALFALAPVIPLRLVDEMGASDGFMSLFAMSGLVTAAGVAAFTYRAIERVGTQATIMLGMVGTGVSAGLLALAPSLAWTLPAGALGGGFWTLAAISLFAYFSENAPNENLTRYTTVYNQVVMLSVFAGPLIGSQLASSPLTLVDVLIIGAGLRVVAGVLSLSGRGKAVARPRPRRRLAARVTRR